jgi:hypothetical protein
MEAVNSLFLGNLALLLFLPWFLVLAGLFWASPRRPRNAARRNFDVVSLCLAALAAVLSTRWGFVNADQSFGGIWPQILATALSYGYFLAVLVVAFYVRRRVLRAPDSIVRPIHGANPAAASKPK